MASSSLVPESSMQEAPTYEIKGRTMSLEEWELNVQVESPVDFISLAHHGCELRGFYHAQDLDDYFRKLNGPAYMNLVRHFWVLEHKSTIVKLLRWKWMRKFLLTPV